MIYTNVKHERNQGVWIDSTTYTGQEVAINTSRPTTTVGGTQVTFGRSKLRVAKPKSVQSCVNDCSVGTVMESVELAFNVTDAASFTALREELLRVLNLQNIEESLLHGIIPPSSETFSG